MTMMRIKRTVALVPGARWLKHRLIGPGMARPGRIYRPSKDRVPVTRPMDRGEAPVIDRDQLKAGYQQSPVSREADTFVLYRIIGNDLPPRHSEGQSRTNLAFILAHEPDLPGCEKRFVVNRIVDPGEEQAVIDLLEQANVHYVHIPFDPKAYREIPWDIAGVPVEFAPWGQRFSRLSEAEQGRILMRLYRIKNNYVMNNNGARNAALRDGKHVAKWVLPWDGNCFVTAAAWNEIVQTVCAEPEVPYFIVPMARTTDNVRLLEAGDRPQAEEEPQILFRRDSALEFDPEYNYGRRPKVELFWRLGVPGIWDSWPLEPWDLPCPGFATEAGEFSRAGWVARLFSGQSHLEQQRQGAALVDRGLARVEAIRQLLDGLDDQVRDDTPSSSRLCMVSPEFDAGIDARLSARLREAADEALTRGPYTVIDKTTLPPSGNRHDYWHPAPYYWPHPLRLPGLAYVRRDGRRVPGTRLYEPLSEKYDRTRLQRLFDDTFVLALAGRCFDDQHYFDHAAELIRIWFLQPETAMNPHLDYAQVRWGHNDNKGTSSGIIEMKDLYYFLDAVRLVQAAGGLSTAEQGQLAAWLEQYLHWLRSSPQGARERASGNNHGTYYDLQVASIAAFLDDRRLVRETLRDSRTRILQQFDADGRQPEEMRRTTTAHYCCFNLQGWIHLAQLAEACGEDLWSIRGSDGQGIARAMHWLLPHIGRKWPYPQIDAFDTERFFPIYHACAARYETPSQIDADSVPAVSDLKPLFFPHDGIMPFWQFGAWRRPADS